MTKTDLMKSAVPYLSKMASGIFSSAKGKSTGGDGQQNAEQGAATSVWCATSPQLAGKGGAYCMNVDIAEVIPVNSVTGELTQVMTGVLPWAIDPELAERLWKLSEELTGVIFEVN